MILIAKTITKNLAHKRSKLRVAHVPMFVFLLGFIMLSVTFVAPAKVHAGGAVGAGGGGGASGSGDEAHWTNRGWTWAIYNIGTPGSPGPGWGGPRDGFRNGYAWTSARDLCTSANTTHVYMNVVYDNFAKAMIYDYKSAQDGPPMYSAHIAAGSSVDGGRATAINTSTARNAYNSIGNPPYNVNTSGYTFGDNVGWFCYNHVAPNVTIQGRVKRSTDGASLSGVSIETCGGRPITTTDGNGDFFASVPNGGGFCARVSSVPAGYNTPHVWPWNEGYYTCAANTRCTSVPTYECQIAGRFQNPDACGINVDRSQDVGFDIALIPNSYIQGRVFNDANGNGSFDSGERYVQNGVSCAGGPHTTLAGVTVTISDSGDYPPNLCNSNPYYRGTAAPGTRTVSVNVPAYWRATTGAQTVNVTAGNTYDRWFGIQEDSCYNIGGFQDAVPAGHLKYGNNCIEFTCDNAGFTTNPTYPVPGQSFTMRVRAVVRTYSSSVSFSDTSKKFRITNSGGISVTTPNPQDFSPNPVSNTTSVYADFTVNSAPAAGTYTVEWELNGTPATGCTRSFDVSNKPYHRVYGGDTLAGVGFEDASTSCPASSIIANKRQLGFTSTAGANYVGGGNSHGNFATGNIVEFISGVLEYGPTNPRTFAFANASGYGGSFQSQLSTACAPNYFSRKPTSTTAITTSPLAVPSLLGNTSYEYTGNLIISAGTVNTGVRATIYVTGNVFIAGNIDYAGSGGYGSDHRSIPSFRLVVRGNIYVADTVTQLNGIFIAQQNGASGGTFYTCAFDRGGGVFDIPSYSISGNTITSSELVQACGVNTLTVYGSVVAQTIKLLRTNGNLPSSPTGFSPDGAAERFIYTPNTWFNGDPSTSKPFQDYTALPTIL